MDDNRPSRRRWFRFSLRTLFVLVTLLCVYFAWAMNWIRQRQEYLRLNPAREVQFSTLVDDPRAPWSLRVFQEPGVARIGLFGQLTADPYASDFNEMDTVSRLFPEAKMDSLSLPFHPDDFSSDKPPRYGFGFSNGMPGPYYQNGEWVFP